MDPNTGKLIEGGLKNRPGRLSVTSGSFRRSGQQYG